MDTQNIPLYENNINDRQLTKSNLNTTGGNMTIDTLTIQHNERIMNHKKKDSNPHLNKFNSAYKYLENKTPINRDSNYNSAKKDENPSKECKEFNENKKNYKNGDSANNNNESNNNEFSIKPKRQYDNYINNNNNNYYSAIKTDNSDNLIKSKANKNSNYNPDKIESNSNNNHDYLSSGIRFYDRKSK